MKRTPRACRVLVRLLATCCASVLVGIGCGEKADPAASRAVEPVTVRLAERLAVADVQPSAEHVAFLDPEERARFRAGWHPAARRDPEGSRWSRSRVGSLDVPVVEPAPLLLALDLTPASSLKEHPANEERQRVAVLWNGEPLAERVLAWRGEHLELRVPADRQHIGNNQLDLLPSYWIRPRAHGLSWDDRALGVRLDGLAARSEAPQVATSSRPVRRRGDALVQQPGSVMSFGLRLPGNARLLGRVAAGDGAPAAGRVLVSLGEPDGGTRLLLDRPLAELAARGGLELAADLPSRPGRYATIDLAFSLPDADAAPPAPEVVWQDLRIEGTRARAPAAASRIPRGAYNVIVLMPDSLRNDHVSGSAEEDTPQVQRLAARGVRFDAMRSNSSWTRPAVASMFTSLGPVSHGIHGLDDKLDPSLAYLPQLLQERGYHTFAVLNSIVASVPFRFGRGYDRVYTYYELRDERRASPDFGPESEVDYVWHEFVEPQRARAGERPFFLFVHEIDPHSPYEPPEPFATRHTSGLEAGFNLSRMAHHDPRQFDVGEMEYLHGLYRGEVAYVDAWLGALLDRLEASGLTRRTLVVLISDHGEEFFEHRGVGHGKTVFEEQLRVPLVMSLPGVLPEGRRSDVPAQTVDLAPTVLDLLGLEIPAAMQGRSLLPWIEHAEAAAERPVVAHAMNRKQESIQVGRWKLVRSNPPHPDWGAPVFALFDLEHDPGEVTDLWQRQPVIGIALRQQLELEIRRQAAATGRKPELEPVPLPPALAEALKALGYGED